MTEKRPNTLLAVIAIIIGISAIPAAFLVHWTLGALMLALPIFIIYRAG